MLCWHQLRALQCHYHEVVVSTIEERLGGAPWLAFCNLLMWPLSRMQGCPRLAIIAHSMGNRIVVTALQQLAARLQSADESMRRAAALLSDAVIIFAAPDVAADDFRTVLQAAPAPQHPSRRTLYLSAADWALRISSAMNRMDRAGLSLNFSPAYETIETRTTLLGHVKRMSSHHSYFAQLPAVTQDMKAVIAEGLPHPASAAGRVRGVGNKQGTLQHCACVNRFHDAHAGRHHVIPT